MFEFVLSQKVLINHKQSFEQQEITSVGTSNESYLHWRKHFHKNPFCFGIYADFEAENEIDNSSVGNKTTNMYKQTPEYNCFCIVSELDSVLQWLI